MADGSFALRNPDPLRLSAHFRQALRNHFDRLGAEDRYLRFGTHSRPEVLDGYVNGIDFQRDVVLGVLDEDLGVIGTAHLGAADGRWELGLSVLPEARRQGIGAALLQGAMQSARAAGARRLVVHCLSANQAMLRLVAKVGAAIVPDAGESYGIIALPASPAGAFGLSAQRMITRRVGAYLGAQASPTAHPGTR